LSHRFQTIVAGFLNYSRTLQPGEWFPFSSEPGPPSYSIVDLRGREISDRWKQSLVMQRLLAQAWAQSEV